MEKKFRNKILKLALPITAQQFMLALVSACDAFMLGDLNLSFFDSHIVYSQTSYGTFYER